MNILADTSTVVIAGLWNVNIFTPDWIATNIFKKKEPPILIEFPMNGLAPIRFTFENVRFFPSIDKVFFSLKKFDIESYKVIVNYALELIKILPHTPNMVIGLNFGFSEENNSKIKNIFDLTNNDSFFKKGEIINSEIRKQIKINDNILLNIFLKYSSIINIDINYHIIFNIIDNLNILLNDDLIIDYYSKTLDLLKSAYDLILEEK
jgi:hypothetical protein